MTLATSSILDFHSLDALRRGAAAKDPAALEQAAVQFESLIIGIMLKSARDASLGDGLLDNSQTQQYLELMDQQVALELARKGGFGFGEMIVEQLSAGTSEVEPFEVGSSEEFVSRLLPEATEVGQQLGVEPAVLLAQAALETGWGRSVPRYPDGRPSHNLFGIKAGPSWEGASVLKWTIEDVGGVARRERARFRAYSSVADGFGDYAKLIAGSPRYEQALSRAGNAESYVRELAAAGYATDPDYAQKWLSIYNGDQLRGTLQTLKEAPGLTTH